MKPLIAIVGNTGAGKSQFAVELAKALNGEVINGDAMQMYHGLDVMTNKHPVPEREGIPHHFIGTEPWPKQLTVQDFESKAVRLIDQLHSRNKVPILVGGTHYYIQSLIAENAIIHEKNSASTDIKDKVFSESQLAILNDPQAVETLLKEVDPVVASKFHPNDTRRLRRALEIWFESGKRPSDIYESQSSGTDGQKTQLRYHLLTFWIWCNKTVLDSRLDDRVDSMLKNNLMNEVRQLYEEYSPDAPQTGIWQVLGFRQFLPYLESPNDSTLASSVQTMKSDTRAYAKKQTKWIRNKLLPMLRSLGGTYALLDSTDIGRFEEDVTHRGLRIARDWLHEDPGFPTVSLVPEHLLDETERRRPAFSKAQWVRYRCDVCSERRETEVVLIGDEDWRVHLKSKQHRYATKKSMKDIYEERHTQI